MACRSVPRPMVLSEQCRSTSSGAVLSCSSSYAFASSRSPSRRTPPRLCLTSRRSRGSEKPILRCSRGDAVPSASADDLDPPQEAVLKAISEVSKSEGRISQTTNVVMGGTVADDTTNEWVVLDQKVNSYPTIRGFTAIGTGGDDFVHSMIVAVESVLQQPIPEGQVTQKVSSGGKYVSVNIGPIEVISSEQVQAIYNAMRRDDRMKYFL